MYRYILRESCSQFDSLPLTSLTVHRVEVAAALGSVYNRLASRLTAATLKEKVLAVLHTWEHWSLFPPFFLIGLEATFLDEDALDAGGPPPPRATRSRRSSRRLRNPTSTARTCAASASSRASATAAAASS